MIRPGPDVPNKARVQLKSFELFASRPALKRYGLAAAVCCALALAGRQSQQIDGEAAFLAGIREIAARIYE